MNQPGSNGWSFSRWIRSQATLSLTDQVIVSGFNFVAGVILARVLGPTGFGVFSLIYMIQLYFGIWQQALITIPMASRLPILDAAMRVNYLRIARRNQLRLSIWVSLSGAVVFAIFPRATEATPDLLVMLCVAGMIFFAQMQEFARRMYYATFRAGSAAINDLISYGLQAAMLLAIAVVNNFNLALALVIIGFTSFIACMVSTLMDGGKYRGTTNSDVTEVKTSLPNIERYLFIGTQIGWLATYGLIMVGSWFFGLEAVGSVRAALILIGPINVVLASADNIMPVECARRFAERGWPELNRYVIRWALQMMCVVLCVLLPILLFGKGIGVYIFGPTYVVAMKLLPWCLAQTLMALSMKPIHYILRTVGDGRGIVLTYAALLTVSLVAFCVGIKMHWGEAILLSASLFGGVAFILTGIWRIGRISGSNKRFS